MGICCRTIASEMSDFANGLRWQSTVRQRDVQEKDLARNWFERSVKLQIFYSMIKISRWMTVPTLHAWSCKHSKNRNKNKNKITTEWKGSSENFNINWCSIDWCYCSHHQCVGTTESSALITRQCLHSIFGFSSTNEWLEARTQFRLI